MARRLMKLLDMVRKQTEQIAPRAALYFAPAFYDFSLDSVVRTEDTCIEFRAVDGQLHAAFLTETREATTLCEGQVALRVSAAAVSGRPGWCHAYPVQIISSGRSS